MANVLENFMMCARFGVGQKVRKTFELSSQTNLISGESVGGGTRWAQPHLLKSLEYELPNVLSQITASDSDNAWGDRSGASIQCGNCRVGWGGGGSTP